MFETTLQNLVHWNQNSSERQKLQHAYIALLMAVVFLAGLVSLFNATRSREIIYVALALVITYATNFVVWALLQTFVIAKLPRNNRPTTARATSRRK